MGLIANILLLGALAALVGAEASCAYKDANGTVISSMTAKGSQRLMCDSGKITVLAASVSVSVEMVVCKDGEWYGLSCDGTVASSVGAEAQVSCPPTPDVLSCPFTGVAQGVPPAWTVMYGAQVRTCDGFAMNIEGVSATLGLTTVTCTEGGVWVAFNCDGSVQPIQGPLVAHCDVKPKCNGISCYCDAGYELRVMNGSEYMTGLSISSNTGAWRLSAGRPSYTVDMGYLRPPDACLPTLGVPSQNACPTPLLANSSYSATNSCQGPIKKAIDINGVECPPADLQSVATCNAGKFLCGAAEFELAVLYC